MCDSGSARQVMASFSRARESSPIRQPFSAGTKDYVLHVDRVGHGAVQSWWTGVCSYAFPGEASFPRSSWRLPWPFRARP